MKVKGGGIYRVEGYNRKGCCPSLSQSISGTTQESLENFNKLNQELPIKINYLEGLINKISYKCPELNKYEISVIVKTFFECLRYLLVVGKVISINSLFPRLQIRLSNRNKSGRYISCLITTIHTPRIMKYHDRI